MKYKIKYYFDGYGQVEIEAKTKDEAKENFFNGEYKQENEYGENYEIDNIKETKWLFIW